MEQMFNTVSRQTSISTIPVMRMTKVSVSKQPDNETGGYGAGETTLMADFGPSQAEG